MTPGRVAGLVFGASVVLSYALFSTRPMDETPRLSRPEPAGVRTLGAEVFGPPATLAAAPRVASIVPLLVSSGAAKDPDEAEFYGPPAPGARDTADAMRGAHDSGLNVITGHIAQGSTLASILEERGVDRATIDLINKGMRPLFDFRYARPGDFFALIRDEFDDLLSFEYQRGRSNVFRLAVNADGEFDVTERELPLERRVVHLGGVIQRSLFDSVRELGEQPQLVHDYADIFIWDFDFASQTRPGDEFRMVFEKFYDQGGFVRYGQILAAQYRGLNDDYTAIFYEDGDGYGDYYTPDGNSVRRTFLRAPVKYSRISSRYTKSRLHPILKIRRPHEGIDYAAPTGTPIWAVADGVVIFKGWSGGLGRLIKIRHNNGYVSYYGHLSRYDSNIKVGSRVQQKQVVGYVGATGLATGPHLDYRLKTGGRFVDPQKIKFPHGDPVPVRERDRFGVIRDELLAELDDVSPPLVLEAGM